MKKQFIFGFLLGISLSFLMQNSLFSANSNRSNITKHTINDQLSFYLPHSTRIVESNLSEKGQLLYSVYLEDQLQLIRGYIQIWNLNDLENYLVDSKNLSTFDFNSYTLKPIKAANKDGYLTEWTASFGVNYKISGMEYWLKKPNTSEVLRISFFTDTPSFSKEQIAYIDNILNSVVWRK